MSAKLIDIKIPQGANFAHVFDIELNDSDGDPVDLTGFTGTMEARAVAGDEVVLADFTVSIDTVARTATAELTAVETEAMDWSCGVYDLVLIDGTDIYRIAQGDVTLDQQVTVVV